MKCKCCGKILKINMGRTKFCNSCSLFTLDLRHENSALKIKARKLARLVYGQVRGSERVRTKEKLMLRRKNDKRK